jgi:hypothetical protein
MGVNSRSLTWLSTAINTRCFSMSDNAAARAIQAVEPTMSFGVEARKERSTRKKPFIPPRVTSVGTLTQLTTQFGGSFFP